MPEDKLQKVSDIVIIGAGPAGLMAARRLGIEETSATLVTRESQVPGENKVCGGFIPMRAIDEFDIGKIDGSTPITGVRMKFPGMKMQHIDFDETIGYDTTRANLGKSLLRLVNQSLIEICMRSSVVEVSENAEHCTVVLKTDEGLEEIRCSIVIDTSGVFPVSVRSSLVRPRLTNQQLGYAIQYQIRREDSEQFENVIEFYYGGEFSPKGYAWIFPRGREAAVGTGGILARVKSVGRKTVEYLEHLMETSPTLNSIGSLDVLKTESAMMPLAGVVRPSYSHRIMLAGDAAAHCSPITGEGIYYSMVGGDLAGAVAARAIKSSNAKFSLKTYEKRWIDRIGSDLKWGLRLQKRLIRSGSQSLGSRFLQSENSRRIIAEMLVGRRHVKSAIISSAPAYLKSKFLK